MEEQLNEMKKILGVDKTQQLIKIAAKKDNLKKISDAKVTSLKNKELQQI